MCIYYFEFSVFCIFTIPDFIFILFKKYISRYYIHFLKMYDLFSVCCIHV